MEFKPSPLRWNGYYGAALFASNYAAATITARDWEGAALQLDGSIWLCKLRDAAVGRTRTGRAGAGVGSLDA